MRKVDIVLIGGLLVIAAGLAWQQVMLRRLAVHVEEGMAEGSRSAAAGGSTPASAQGSVGTAASSGVTESSSTAQAQLELVMGLSRHSDRQVRQGAVLILGRLGLSNSSARIDAGCGTG